MRRRRKKIDLVLKIVLSKPTKGMVRIYIAGMAKAAAVKLGELNICLPRSV